MTTTLSAADDREVVFTRIIQAPRALVFQAWTDPAHLSKWWGPHGMTNPVCEVDLRPGGAQRIVMRSADGVEYPMRGVFHEIVEPERLVYSCIIEDHPAEWHAQLRQNYGSSDSQPTNELLFTVTFEEFHGHTRITILTRFPATADRAAFLKMGMSEGWGQSLEKLEALLAG
jgi:uncharacterized protein YndB with AHSA1/START domain